MPGVQSTRPHKRGGQECTIPQTNTPLATTPSTPTATSLIPPATPSPTPPPPLLQRAMRCTQQKRVKAPVPRDPPAASQGQEESRSKHNTLRFTACHRTGNSKRERNKSPDVQRISGRLGPRHLSSAQRKPRQSKAKLTGREAALIAD